MDFIVLSLIFMSICDFQYNKCTVHSYVIETISTWIKLYWNPACWSWEALWNCQGVIDNLSFELAQ